MMVVEHPVERPRIVTLQVSEVLLNLLSVLLVWSNWQVPTNALGGWEGYLYIKK